MYVCKKNIILHSVCPEKWLDEGLLAEGLLAEGLLRSAHTQVPKREDEWIFAPLRLETLFGQA